MTRPVRIVPLYPELLSIYADRGNVRVLEQRARWRGVPVEVAPVALGEDVDPGASDLILIGGGQDRDQVLVAEELLRQTPALRAALDDGAALLAVCGGYQLLGHRYRGHQGDEIPGTGLVDLETLAGDARSIGNVVVDCDLPGCGPQRLVGFENHAGRTRLGAGVAPLGRVAHGGGNNGEDGGEGCVQGRIVGTYVHGPLLPKNPWLADLLLRWACARAGVDEARASAPLDDDLERLAAVRAAEVAFAERR